MTGNNLNLDLVNIKSYTKLSQIPSIYSKDIERKQNCDINQGHYFGSNEQKMTGNNPNLDLVNINAYVTFGQIITICSQDIEQKQNSDINQGP